MKQKNHLRIVKRTQYRRDIKDAISKYFSSFHYFYQNSSLRLYSRGGSEFVVPLHFQVENVYPIENGIIAKLQYDKDLLIFDPFQIRREQFQQKPNSYAYMTITDHPLDDIHPLSFGGKSDLISTQMDILFVSYKIPFIVFYNPQAQQVIFGFLKRRSDDSMAMQDVNDDGESYIKSIDPESRNPDIYNISKDFKIYFQEIYSFSSAEPPSKIFLSKGLTNSYELIVTLFYASQKKVEILSCDIRQPKMFKKMNEINQIKDVNQIHFSRQKYFSEDKISVISKTKAANLAQLEAKQSYCSEIKLMKQRIKYFTKDTILCDEAGKTISIFQGGSFIFTFDVFQFLETQFDKSIVPKTAKIESLTDASKSNVTMNFSNGVSKRFSFRLQITDFLVKSIMKTLRIILPTNLYENLNADLVDILSRGCNNVISKQQQPEIDADQFAKFSNMLLALLAGEQQSASQKPTQVLVSQIIQQQQQQQQVQQQIRPTQTLQTKILRSSTTSFGTDSMANRRKAQNINLQQQQQMIQQQQRQQQQLRSSVVGTQSSAQQKRVAISGGVEPQPLNLQTTSSFQQTSANPFADLLNSDFHKDNFKTSFAQFFPSDMVLQPPIITSPIQESQPFQISPTKQSTKTTAQRVSSTRQSNVLQSQHERKNSNISQPQPLQTFVNNSLKTQKSQLLPFFNSIFQVLHLLYEDLKLNKLRDAVESPRLAKLLIKLALYVDPLKKAAFIDYYFKEYPNYKDEFNEELKKVLKDGHIIKEGVDLEPVPRLYKWLESCLKKQQNVLNYPYPLFFENSRKIVRIYEILNNSQKNSEILSSIFNNIQNMPIEYQSVESMIFNKGNYTSFDFIDYRDYLKQDKSHGQQNLHLFEKILFTLKEENLSLEEIKKLPSIVALPILEIIRYARLFQQEIQTVPEWPDSLYKLIQREDILNNLRLFQRNKDHKLANLKKSLLSPTDLTFTKQPSKKFALTRGMTNVFKGTTFEELQQEQHRRAMETNIMRAAADLNINSQGKIGSGETEKQNNSQIMDFLRNRFSTDTRFKEVQNMLNSSNEIIIKMEHIANRESLAEEALNTEKQKLLDKMFLRHLAKSVGRGALTFGTVQTLPTETLHIPKINQTGYVPMNETYMQVEFKDEACKDILQWPEFHNGVAAALRIAQSFNKGAQKNDINQQSHTRNWIMYHKPQEPKYEHGGFLLAIGLLGQFDTLQSTDIYQHLKPAHDATSIGMLLGRAASKIGTMDDHDTRTLCIHIPYLLPANLAVEISLPVQSAAVIGAGLLYKGTSNRLMTEMLLAQIGRKPLSDKAIEREGFALASGIALGLVNLGIGNKIMQGLSDLKLDERLIRYVEGGKILDLPQSMLSQNFNHDNTKCSSIKEGDMVNVHITSSGALIALALIHLKSNNKTIANSLIMPQSFYSLESVRPSFLLLKVLCKNLILWDEIQSSDEWVLSQIPEIIKEIYENEIAVVEKKFQQKIIEDGIDYSTVALCYENIIAGAIFAIGFKYAGTGNKEAFKLVMKYEQHFREQKILQSNKDYIGVIHNDRTKNQIDKNTLETCLCVSAYAMSMIMAGTGDVECFRVLRVLRKRFEHDMHYGYNMAIHMSLGFLFLGSGAFTFSRNDLAIAALLCALYPVFPQTPGDNRYHLQALRHFYVLAIESRLLQARDIDSGEFLNIDMKVEVEEVDTNGKEEQKISQVMEISTPDIINGKIKSVEVKNEKYHTVSLKFENDEDDKMQMEIDDQTQLIDKKQKIFEQFDFQKIVYVKKKVSSNIIEDQSSQKMSKNLINETITENLENIDINSRELVEEGPKIYERIRQIKDSSIEAFYKNFSFLEEMQNIKSLSDIEDVLLAQNRDPYSQLSPIEFFKIQDLYDEIKQCMLANQIPLNLKQKLLILKTIHDCYYHDKLELIRLLLDLQLSTSPNFKSYNKKRLLQAYSLFRNGQSQLNILSRDPLEVDTLDQQIPKDKQAQLFAKMLTSYHQVDTNEAAFYGFDLHEMQIAKIIVESLLSEVKAKGENEVVKKYKFSKINGLGIEGASEQEVNEMLKMSIEQLFGDQMIDTNYIDEVILKGVLQIEKS